ncbi:hypothetical protein HPB50_026499 [Hyalomma asiaticum]|uniref:Uncharacterized protein n=1 Tax=Hyalomma asiaticum TaxID=266040 RepID=A0ACB7STP7_HYAAI|nr:hypothetical protein HPB50_026499 [Hyalomma asiaticum]
MKARHYELQNRKPQLLQRTSATSACNAGYVAASTGGTHATSRPQTQPTSSYFRKRDRAGACLASPFTSHTPRFAGQSETTKSLAIGNHADVSCYRIVSARAVGKRSPTVLLVRGDMSERTKSAIWKYFVKNSAQEATCKSCDMKLRTPSSTTPPLANHLKNKHFSLHSVFLRDSGKHGRPDGAQPLIKSALKSGKDLPQRERTAITTRIARMLALDLQPYSCVENRGFKELMNHMQPLYKIPSRTTFSRTIIPELYRDTVTAVKERIHADFQEGVESISLTSDMWTSRSNESYISLTCHYLTSNFEIRSFALENRSVTESHTALSILEHLQAMIDNWELPLQKVPLCVVTDNARNFRAALRGISCVPMQCMGHTLQLAIKDAKEETAGVPAILKKCRAIVGHYKHSAQAAARLQDCQQRMELSVLELIQDVETRWNSEHDMLSRLVQLKEAICLELATSETSVPNLTPQEWKAVAGLVKTLETIASATKELSGHKYATLSSVVLFLYGTQTVLKDCIAADDDTSEFARNLLKSIRKRFPGQDEQKEYVLATACDPRFKNLFCAEPFQETRLLELARTELQLPPQWFGIFKNSLKWLDDWEQDVCSGAIFKDMFLTQLAPEGLQVTMLSMLELSERLLNQCGFKYVLTGKLSQDLLERFFGKAQQAGCENNHQNMSTFVKLYWMLTVCSLLKLPKLGNCEVHEKKPILDLSSFRTLFMKADWLCQAEIAKKTAMVLQLITGADSGAPDSAMHTACRNIELLSMPEDYSIEDFELLARTCTQNVILGDLMS